MLDVLDLLAQDRSDKSCMRLIECLEVALATEIERTDATQARRSRAFDHMVADREHPCGRNDRRTGRPSSGQAAPVRSEWCPNIPIAGSTEPAVSARSFAKAASLWATANASRHNVSARLAVTMDTAQIEEDID